MRLGVFNNQEFYTDGTRHSTGVSFYNFVASFSEYCDEIVVFAPAKTVGPSGHLDYPCPDGISLAPLPYYSSASDLYKRLPVLLGKTISAAREQLSKCDVVWLIQPHPLAWLLRAMVRVAGLPMFLHIRGNVLVDVKTRYKGLKYIMAKTLALASHYNNVSLVRKVPTFVVGRELYGLYARNAEKIFNISPSLISSEHIHRSRLLQKNRKARTSKSVRLIFVGRVEPEKGLRYLFEAIKMMRNEMHMDVHLIIVGAAQRGSEAKEQEIRRLADELRVSDRIEWAGYAPFGETLFHHYRNADIFILPSLSEGIPKVLYEAMAFGLPIVTTNVGGTSDVVKHRHNGICIPLRSPKAIAEAVQQVVQDPDLGDALVREGFKVAEEHTMEKARDAIYKNIVEPLVERNMRRRSEDRSYRS